ncbi:MAG: CBS domain-containing protein, partial [Saprospiraceae bacterium]|nr:CBS domain-containing protein [Saprospiraceae bacterium]
VRGFTTADFAKFHPGGALGKQLYLRVGELCALHDRPRVSPDSTLQEVILEISSKRLGATAVIDGAGQLHGIVTDGDLRRMLQRGADFNNLTAKHIMSPTPKTIGPDALAVDALALMRKHAITQLLVFENETYQGIVHLHDLVREGLV